MKRVLLAQAIHGNNDFLTDRDFVADHSHSTDGVGEIILTCVICITVLMVITAISVAAWKWIRKKQIVNQMILFICFSGLIISICAFSVPLGFAMLFLGGTVYFSIKQIKSYGHKLAMKHLADLSRADDLRNSVEQKDDVRWMHPSERKKRA